MACWNFRAWLRRRQEPDESALLLSRLVYALDRIERKVDRVMTKLETAQPARREMDI